MSHSSIKLGAVRPKTSDSAAAGKASRRDALLSSFAQAVAARPFNLQNIKKLSTQLEEELGKGALIEAASTCGGMEVATRVVDTSGRVETKGLLLLTMNSVLALIGWIVSLFSS